MDIDFIELEHRENVLKLMEICGLEMKEAYNLLADSQYNFQNAVNRHFNPPPPPPVQQPPMQQRPAINFNSEPQQFYEGGFQQDGDFKYQDYRRFVKQGKSFDKKYPVRKHQNFLKSLLPKFFKGEEESVFRKDLQKFIGKNVNIKTYIGNLSQAFELSWSQKFPLAIIILDFLPQSQDSIKKIFSDDCFVEKTLCEQFTVYGFNAFEYQLQNELKPIINPERDTNSLIICRVNHIDQIEVVQRIRLNDAMEVIKKKIKQAKSECIQSEMDESNIVKQYNEERRGNYNYQRPKTTKESIKLREDRKLRQQQEEEYMKSFQPKAQKEQTKPNVPVSTQQQQKIEKKEEVPKKPEVSSEQIQKSRQIKLNSLKKYENGVIFKIRVPSGKNFIITIAEDENIQYLFDFIENQIQDLGFNNQNQRNFDLFMGFGGSQTLKGKETMKIKELFEGSQALIVRQI